MMTRRRVGLGVGVVLTLGIVAAQAPAWADGGANLPPGANQQSWNQVWTVLNKEPYWGPTGTMIRDSGFRPFPNGFGFFNMGVPDEPNAMIFGTPKSGPKNLDADEMRDLMGPQVCVEGRESGTCTLTLSARQWMVAANKSMAGGHCFGIAATTGLMYSGDLDPATYTAGATQAYDVRYETPIEREIARNMAAQFAMDLSPYEVTPTEAVEVLQEALSQGSTPLTLAMYFSGGGHAVNPYALYDRGGGQYDIALYDNNYPDDPDRAMRIDTVKDTARYMVTTNPNGQPLTKIDGLLLIPNEVIGARHPCPFCAGAQETVVQLSPVRSQVPIKTRISTLNGGKLRGVKVQKPTTPWEPGRKWNFPTYTVPQGKDFVVTVNGKRSKKALRTSFVATTGTFSLGADRAFIPAHGRGRLGLSPKDGLVVYQSRDRRLGDLTFVDSLLPDQSATAIRARATTPQSPAVVGAVEQASDRVALFTADKSKGAAEAVATHQYLTSKGRAAHLTASVSATLPRRAALVLDYAHWDAQHKKGLKAKVVLASGRSHSVKVHY